MKRATGILVLIVAAGCGGEADEPAARSNATPPRSVTTAGAKAVPTDAVAAPAPVRKVLPTPGRCSGDGSYAAALDCFRITSGFRFNSSYGAARAEGEMSRPAPGAELVAFRLTRSKNDGSWIGARKPAGMVWWVDSKRVTNPPAVVNELFQRITIPFDPQKKEGRPVMAGREDVNGVDSMRYHFTDANNGEQYDVWISSAGGEFLKRATHAPAQFQEIRPDFSMTISESGKAQRIEEGQ